MSTSYSERESLRDFLITELGKISVDNGYRTSPKLVTNTILWQNEVTEFPVLILSFESEDVNKVDDNRTIFNSDFRINVVGYYCGDLEYSGIEKLPALTDGEPLLHDLKRCITGISLDYINHESVRWHILGKSIRCYGPSYVKGRNMGEVRVEFYARIDHQPTDF